MNHITGSWSEYFGMRREQVTKTWYSIIHLYHDRCRQLFACIIDVQFSTGFMFQYHRGVLCYKILCQVIAKLDMTATIGLCLDVFIASTIDA